MEFIALKTIYYLIWIAGILTIGLLLIIAIDYLAVAIIKRMGIFPALYDFIWERSRKKHEKE